MLPSYQEYYYEFIQKINELPEETQKKLLEILCKRYEEGIIPKKKYDDEKYYDFTHGINEELSDYLEIFDNYFLPSNPDELVKPEINNMALEIIEEFYSGVEKIKTSELKYYSSSVQNQIKFMIKVKNINTSIFKKTKKKLLKIC